MNVTEQEVEFLETVKDAEKRGPAALLMLADVMETTAGKAFPFRVEQYSRGDLKRAIRYIREVQVLAPQYAETYEHAIAHIRSNWPHKGGAVMKMRLEYQGAVPEYEGPKSRLWAVRIAAIYGYGPGRGGCLRFPWRGRCGGGKPACAGG